MKRQPVKNIAASVHQRLLNVAKQVNRPFNDLVQHYAEERWLYRLSRSEFRDRFILKGALMLLVWKTPVTRPTRDIDLLGYVSNDLESIRAVIGEICRVDVEDDGVVFDPVSVITEPIVEDADYEGIRVTFRGRLGNTRIAMQIDIAFGDVITPAPVEISFPTILEQPAVKLRAYNRETAIAEKFEAMVRFGELNSRMKDFFDIWLLAESFEFDGQPVADAVRATFTHRRTEIDAAHVCFSDRFSHDASKATQWKAFIRRSLLTDAPTGFTEVVEGIRSFLRPVITSLLERRDFPMRWQPRGPWRIQCD